jgi:hypothetical protein
MTSGSSKATPCRSKAWPNSPHPQPRSSRSSPHQRSHGPGRSAPPENYTSLMDVTSSKAQPPNLDSKVIRSKHAQLTISSQHLQHQTSWLTASPSRAYAPSRPLRPCLVRVACLERALRARGERVQNSDNPLARAILLVGVEHHGCLTQGPRVTHDLSISRIAELRLSCDDLLLWATQDPQAEGNRYRACAQKLAATKMDTRVSPKPNCGWCAGHVRSHAGTSVRARSNRAFGGFSRLTLRRCGWRDQAISRRRR